jgi:flagellar motility protein MotE (MotC chaperone)
MVHERDNLVVNPDFPNQILHNHFLLRDDVRHADSQVLQQTDLQNRFQRRVIVKEASPPQEQLDVPKKPIQKFCSDQKDSINGRIDAHDAKEFRLETSPACFERADVQSSCEGLQNFQSTELSSLIEEKERLTSLNSELRHKLSQKTKSKHLFQLSQIQKALASLQHSHASLCQEEVAAALSELSTLVETAVNDAK